MKNAVKIPKLRNALYASFKMRINNYLEKITRRINCDHHSYSGVYCIDTGLYMYKRCNECGKKSTRPQHFIAYNDLCMEKKKIIMIGAGNTGLTAALELTTEQNNTCILHSVVDSQFTDLKEPEPFLITGLPVLPEIWTDPKEPIINYKKHNQSCLKNRKARKNKKRR